MIHRPVDLVRAIRLSNNKRPNAAVICVWITTFNHHDGHWHTVALVSIPANDVAATTGINLQLGNMSESREQNAFRGELTAPGLLAIMTALWAMSGNREGPRREPSIS